jgi:hypothetical protein
MIQIQNNYSKGAGEKKPASIIRRVCVFDRKFGYFFGHNVHKPLLWKEIKILEIFYFCF